MSRAGRRGHPISFPASRGELDQRPRYYLASVGMFPLPGGQFQNSSGPISVRSLCAPPSIQGICSEGQKRRPGRQQHKVKLGGCRVKIEHAHDYDQIGVKQQPALRAESMRPVFNLPLVVSPLAIVCSLDRDYASQHVAKNINSTVSRAN